MNQASAIGIGVLISLMLMANGALQTSYGGAIALLVIHATGATALLLLLWVRRKSFKTRERVPLYLFSAGAIGVALVSINNTTVASIGLTLTIALGVVGQLILSALIDQYGLFGLARRPSDARKVLGYALIGTGIAVMAWSGVPA